MKSLATRSAIFAALALTANSSFAQSYKPGSVYPLNSGQQAISAGPIDAQKLYCSSFSSPVGGKPTALGVLLGSPVSGAHVSIGIYAMDANSNATGAPLGTAFDLDAGSTNSASGAATFVSSLAAGATYQQCVVADKSVTLFLIQQPMSLAFPGGTTYSDPTINGVMVTKKGSYTPVTYTGTGQASALPNLTSATWSPVSAPFSPAVYFTAP